MPTDYAIKNGRTVMDATTYTGTGSSTAIVNAGGFKPDLVWIKGRGNAYDHDLFDSIRGTLKHLSSNLTNAEYTEAAGATLTAFNTNGFQLGTDNAGDGSVNNSTRPYVGWQWQAGQGTTSSNTSGSITSTVSVNATAGFSIVTYTGTGANATVGHGLGVAPSFIIFKSRTTAGSNWKVYTSALGATKQLNLNLTIAATTETAPFNNTAPTSSVFTVGTNPDTNESAANFVAYCWSEIAGFSKFGSYTGNGSTDGPFVYTGFRPKFVLIKSSSIAGSYWVMQDTTRNTYNVMNSVLYPNASAAEATTTNIDSLSNGFKLRTLNSDYNNSSSDTYIYMAFAENPFKYANAR